MPGSKTIPTPGLAYVRFSADGTRMLAQGDGAFDVYAMPALRRVRRDAGAMAVWSGPHSIAYADGRGHLAWVDLDDAGQNKVATGALCDPANECGRPGVPCSPHPLCRNLFIMHATPDEALIGSTDPLGANVTLRVTPNEVRDLAAAFAIGDLVVFKARASSTGLLCLARETSAKIGAPVRETEVGCARSPYASFDIIWRGHATLPQLEIVDDRFVIVSPGVTQFSTVTVPLADAGGPQVVMRKADSTSYTHCIVPLDTRVARCTDEARFGQPWMVLADGKTVIQESTPPMWERPLILDLEAGTYAAFASRGEYQGTWAWPGHPDRFVIGLDRAGEGNRDLYTATIR